jgi:hypothetical protein
MVYTSCLEALKQFRQDRFFHAQLDEQAILINLFMGDQSDETLINWAVLLNSPDLCAHFQQELEQGYLAFRQLVDS